MKKLLCRLVSVMCILAAVVGCFTGCGNQNAKNDPHGGRDETADAVDNSWLDVVSTKSKNPDDVSNISYAGGDTVKVGVHGDIKIADPFEFETVKDTTAADLIMLRLLERDRDGYVVKNGLSGETAQYNGTEYAYSGIAEVEVKDNRFEFTLDENVYFSDGINLTADDVIFTMYVLADPVYDGNSSFAELPIEGLKEYRGSMQHKWKVILKDLIADKKSRSYTKQDKTDLMQAFEEAGLEYTRNIVSGCVKNFANDYSDFVLGLSADAIMENEGYQIAFSQFIWDYSAGYGEDGLWYDVAGNSYDLIETFPTIESYWQLIFDKYGYDISDQGINYEKIGDKDFEDILLDIINEKYPHLIIATMDGGSADSISGIQKTGPYSFAVSLPEASPEYLDDFCIYIAPLHHYGSREDYKYSENKFGFVKGDLTEIKSKLSEPKGAGAYAFDKTGASGELYLSRNTLYYKGCPNIENLILTTDYESADIVFEETAGESDYADGFVEVNSNTYVSIGINAAAVCVGADPLSDASVNLRNAFSSVISAYREAAVEQWGNSGVESVTDGTVWAKDFNVLTRMARINAVRCLRDAGYVWDYENEVFVEAPEGAYMSYEVKLYENDAAYIALNYAKELFADIGINLEISVQSSSKSLENIVHAGEAQIWVMKIDEFTTEDIYSLFHSEGYDNVFSASTKETDNAIEWADGLFLKNVRAAMYSEIIDKAIDLGVYVPVYKHVNAVVYSENIVAESLASDITAYWPWVREVHMLEAK